MLAYHFILHTPVAPISTSPLPAALCPLYLYTHFINNYLLTYPTHCLAHEPPPPSLLTDSQHAAGKRASLLEGCPFSPPTPPGSRAKKGTPPRPYVFYFVFLPLRCGCDVSFAPQHYSLPDVAPSPPLARQVFARTYPESAP